MKEFPPKLLSIRGNQCHAILTYHRTAYTSHLVSWSDLHSFN